MCSHAAVHFSVVVNICTLQRKGTVWKSSMTGCTTTHKFIAVVVVIIIVLVFTCCEDSV